MIFKNIEENASKRIVFKIMTSSVFNPKAGSFYVIIRENVLLNTHTCRTSEGYISGVYAVKFVLFYVA